MDKLCKGKEEFTYEEDKLYPALIKSTDDYIYVCNMKTGVFCYPPNMVEEFGMPGCVMENALEFWRTKVHPNDWEDFLEANMEISEGRTDSHSVEYRVKNKNGEWVWLRCRGNVERDQDGSPAVFAGIMTNLGRKNKIDPLTGLFNKYDFEAKCRENLENMKDVIERLKLNPGNLVLEATESHLASNIGKFYEALRQIQDIGIYTSMDDFGTGYSSLGILKQAPFNIVKIDKTFVKGIRDSKFDYTFIKLVVELCHTNGISVCIEGVEEEEELEILKSIELDFMQGFLFSRPVPPGEFERRFLQS